MGKKIFAYLKDSPKLPLLLRALNDLAQPTLLFGDGIPPALQRRYESTTLRFVAKRLDPNKAAQRCDVGLTNATFGTTSLLLQAGKPVLTVPLVLEQAILAQVVQRLGVGLEVSFSTQGKVPSCVNAVLEGAHFAARAGELARSWSDFDAAHQEPAMLQRMRELLSLRLARGAMPTLGDVKSPVVR